MCGFINNVATLHQNHLWFTSKRFTSLLVWSVRPTDSTISSGISQSEIAPMKLFFTNPSQIDWTARGLCLEVTSNWRYTSLTFAVAATASISFHSSSLKPFWIRREHRRNKSHYPTQNSLTMECSQSITSAAHIKCVCQYSQYTAWYMYIIYCHMYELDGHHDM